jgi:hypothetical protein
MLASRKPAGATMNPMILVAVLCLGAVAGAWLRSEAVLAAKGSLGLAAGVLLAQVLSMLLRFGHVADADEMLEPILVALHVAWALTVAYAIGAAFPSTRGNGARQRALWLATVGAALLVAGKFLLFEVGKIRHNEEMEQFFLSSGYPAFLHYVVMALELTGSLALLFFAKRRPGLAAAIGLGVIMAGAVATHMRNGDPLSDSYDAISQAVYIATYLVAAVLAMRATAPVSARRYAR